MFRFLDFNFAHHLLVVRRSEGALIGRPSIPTPQKRAVSCRRKKHRHVRMSHSKDPALRAHQNYGAVDFFARQRHSISQTLDKTFVVTSLTVPVQERSHEAQNFRSTGPLQHTRVLATHDNFPHEPCQLPPICGPRLLLAACSANLRRTNPRRTRRI